MLPRDHQPNRQEILMSKLLTMAAIAVAILAGTPAFAQYQGSNQSGDYALSWRAASGGYGAYRGAYARYGYGRYHRRWR
jgi:opacity protein-like surface antigen